MKEIKIPNVDDGRSPVLVLRKTENGIEVYQQGFPTIVSIKALLEGIVDLALHGVDVITDDTIDGMGVSNTLNLVGCLGCRFRGYEDGFHVTRRPARVTERTPG